MTPRVLAGIGVAVVAVVIGAAFAVDGDRGVNNDGVTATVPADDAAGAAPPTVAVPDLSDRGQHQELVDIDGWLQSDVTSLEELEGKVVAVQFWTFGCRNCKATLPHMRDLYEKYQDQGFEIVGVHSPEFDNEAVQANIIDAAADLGVTWPIALDTAKRTFHSWQEGPTAHWPRIYLLDRDGHIRYDHIGEGRYDQIDAAVEALLAEPA
ncbi:MAG TPA: redoxin domain-containing protein [Ilumatobacteraceae bacterium]|nr:redoxin domain-containing protein [Ilumatobacteraceae bacterium]